MAGAVKRGSMFFSRVADSINQRPELIAGHPVADFGSNRQCAPDYSLDRSRNGPGEIFSREGLPFSDPDVYG